MLYLPKGWVAPSAVWNRESRETRALGTRPLNLRFAGDDRSVKFEMHGFDELQRKLEDLQRRMERLQGKRKVPLDTLFPPEFMKRYTKHAGIQDMFTASPWKVETQGDLAAIPDDEWDAFVRQETQFPSWKEMMGKAVGEYVRGELGLK